jgi:hypothetical protein
MNNLKILIDNRGLELRSDLLKNGTTNRNLDKLEHYIYLTNLYNAIESNKTKQIVLNTK